MQLDFNMGQVPLQEDPTQVGQVPPHWPACLVVLSCLACHLGRLTAASRSSRLVGREEGKTERRDCGQRGSGFASNTSTRFFVFGRPRRERRRRLQDEISRIVIGVLCVWLMCRVCLGRVKLFLLEGRRVGKTEQNCKTKFPGTLSSAFPSSRFGETKIRRGLGRIWKIAPARGRRVVGKTVKGLQDFQERSVGVHPLTDLRQAVTGPDLENCPLLEGRRVVGTTFSELQWAWPLAQSSTPSQPRFR